MKSLFLSYDISYLLLSVLPNLLYNNDSDFCQQDMLLRSTNMGSIIQAVNSLKFFTEVRFIPNSFFFFLSTFVHCVLGLEEGGAQLSFIVGGFDGLPDKIKIKYPLISLSNLTWTHQMARLLLIEQIYRATEIRKNSKYHKD